MEWMSLMLIATDDPQPATGDPEALIEEARRHHRLRVRRRATLLTAVLILAPLGLGIDRLARGGVSPRAQSPASAGLANPLRAVTYEKVETVKIVPDLPTQRRIVQIWSTTNAPTTYRELLRTTGQPSLEVGAAPGHDSQIGAEQIVYLYQPSSNTIYVTGAYPALPPPRPHAAISPAAQFQQLIHQPGAHLVGKRTIDGHSVYVVKTLEGQTEPVQATLYIDDHTYQPIITVTTSPALRIIRRVLAFKTLRATSRNLNLTTLAAAHRHARTLPAPARIKALYDDAANFLNVSSNGISS